jgi:hypothetical protein
MNTGTKKSRDQTTMKDNMVSKIKTVFFCNYQFH